MHAKKGKPYLLAFFFSPNVPITVTAEVQRIEDGSKNTLNVPKNPSLSTPENWVYTVNFTPTMLGWHVVQYRAKSPDDDLVWTDLSRFLVEEEDPQTQVTNQIQEGKMVTSVTTNFMNNRGIISFKTRTK